MRRRGGQGTVTRAAVFSTVGRALAPGVPTIHGRPDEPNPMAP